MSIMLDGWMDSFIRNTRYERGENPTREQLHNEYAGILVSNMLKLKYRSNKC